MEWNEIKRITNFFEVNIVIVYSHFLWNSDSLNSFTVCNVNCFDSHIKCILEFKIIQSA